MQFNTKEEGGKSTRSTSKESLWKQYYKEMTYCEKTLKRRQKRTRRAGKIEEVAKWRNRRKKGLRKHLLSLLVQYSMVWYV